MIKLEHTDVVGVEAAVRGMRNPMNSWEKSDSTFSCDDCDNCYYATTANAITVGDERIINWCNHTGLSIGSNDHKLMMSLAKGGPVHAKYRRMINVYVDITAPFYWWKEFDTYKVGTVANSCSTMHKIHAKEFTREDFSCEHLLNDDTGPQIDCDNCASYSTINSMELLNLTVDALNHYRGLYLLSKDKKYWWQMIQLLPTSYNQKRTVMLNYEVLHNIYHSRKNHKLDEWHVFCDWIKDLPYSEIIIGEETE